MSIRIVNIMISRRLSYLLFLLMSLNIMSWNATGTMSSSSYLCKCLEMNKIDICGLSEHWLSPRNSHFLNDINSNYNWLSVCDTNLLAQNRGYDKGGVAFMWNKKLDNHISPIQLDDDRLLGLQVHFSHLTLYIFQVYLPSSNNNIELFKSYIEKLNELAGSYLPQSKFRKFLKPYLNNDLKYLQKTMRSKRQVWILDGKPRSSIYVSYKEYKNAKKQFRKLHRQCANRYLKQRDEEIDKAADVDSDYFWKLINSRKIKI